MRWNCDVTLKAVQSRLRQVINCGDDRVTRLEFNVTRAKLIISYTDFAIALFTARWISPNRSYGGPTIYLLISVGWHSGKEMVSLSAMKTLR